MTNTPATAPTLISFRRHTRAPLEIGYDHGSHPEWPNIRLVEDGAGTLLAVHCENVK